MSSKSARSNSWTRSHRDGLDTFVIKAFTVSTQSYESGPPLSAGGQVVRERPEFLRKRATSHNEFIMQRVPFRSAPAWPPFQNVRLRLSPHILKLRPPSGLKQKSFCFPVPRLSQAALRRPPISRFFLIRALIKFSSLVACFAIDSIREIQGDDSDEKDGFSSFGCTVRSSGRMHNWQ